MRLQRNRATHRFVLLFVAAATCASCGPRWDTERAATPATVAPVAPTTTLSDVSTSTTGLVPPDSTLLADATTSTTTGTSVPATSAAPSTTIDQASTIATITTNWQTFFANTSSVDDRVALLEDGESLRDAVTQRAQDPLMGQATATVVSVELSAPDQATVTYNVLLNGSVALPNAQGTAVLQDGVWKVGSASFCALISLGATAPIPGC